MRPISTEQEITLEERNELSGYQSKASDSEESLVESQYLLLDEESGEVRGVSEKGTVRLGVVALGVATILGLGWFFWQVVSPKSVPPRDSVKATVKEQPKEPEATAELDQLKAELALREQGSRPATDSGALNKPLREPPESQMRVTQPKSVKAVPPSSPPSRRSASVPSRPSPPYRPVTPYKPVTHRIASTSRQTPDPNALWSQLAQRGHASAGVIDWQTSTREAKGTRQTPPSGEREKTGEFTAVTAEKELPLPRAVIGTPNRLDGRAGILSRTPVVSSPSGRATAVAAKEVGLGANCRGKVIVPLIWSEGGEQVAQGRFVVELTEDLLGMDGTVDLARGTLVVAQAQSVSAPSGMVVSEAIAVVYRDGGGQAQEQPLQGALAILGEGNSPLIAQHHFDYGGDIASNDVLLGTLSALGKVGEIVNQPQEVIEDDNLAAGSSRRVTRRGEPNLLAAALEGFFKPVSSSMARRSEQSIKELQGRKNIAVVPEGTEVSVLVKSFLTVTP